MSGNEHGQENGLSAAILSPQKIRIPAYYPAFQHQGIDQA